MVVGADTQAMKAVMVAEVTLQKMVCRWREDKLDVMLAATVNTLVKEEEGYDDTGGVAEENLLVAMCTICFFFLDNRFDCVAEVQW